MLNTLSRALIAVATAFCFIVPTAHASDVIIQGTTDIRDAGLLNDVLVPGFNKAYPQYNLVYVPVGTGQAIAAAEAGGGDGLVVHAPTQEKGFVDGGYSLEPYGRAIFYSDYVILGPLTDPAGVLSCCAHDAAAAYEKIAAAGTMGNANFVSRGDNSGTNTQEKLIWALTSGITLNTKNEPGDGTSTGNPAWYHKAGLGQADTVLQASECAFTGGNCYEMTDRGTFNRLVKNGSVDNLKVVSDRTASTARGGMNLLTNPFSAYAVNPAKVPGVNVEGAKAFLTYLTTRSFQAGLKGYPSKTQPAFFADARPEVTLDSPQRIPHKVRKGRRLTFSGTIAHLLPGAPTLANKPVIAERIVKTKDGGRIYKRQASGLTDGKGRFSLSFRARKGGKLRLRFPITLPDLSIVPLIASGSLQEQTLGLGRFVVLKRKHK